MKNVAIYLGTSAAPLLSQPLATAVLEDDGRLSVTSLETVRNMLSSAGLNGVLAYWPPSPDRPTDSQIIATVHLVFTDERDTPPQDAALQIFLTQSAARLILVQPLTWMSAQEGIILTPVAAVVDRLLRTSIMKHPKWDEWSEDQRLSRLESEINRMGMMSAIAFKIPCAIEDPAEEEEKDADSLDPDELPLIWWCALQMEFSDGSELTVGGDGPDGAMDQETQRHFSRVMGTVFTEDRFFFTNSSMQ